MSKNTRIHNFLNSERGFSLTEIMISLGLLGIVTFSAITLMKSSYKSQKTLEQNYSIQNVMNNINQIMKNESVCTETLKGFLRIGKIPDEINNGVVIPTIKSPNKTYYYKSSNDPAASPLKKGIYPRDPPFTGNIIPGKGRIRITDFRLINFEKRGDSFKNLAGNNVEYGDITLKISFQRPREKDAFSTNTINHYIHLRVLTSASTEKIVSCYSADNYYKSACQAMGGKYDGTTSKCDFVDICFGEDCRSDWPTLQVRYGCKWRNKKCNSNEAMIKVNTSNKKVYCCPIGVRGDDI
ncbi:MAG: type II secretion system protein [Bacteriovoracaceae bacterium]|nr:type II secretion system protein [Bacteriovoracaceae bacterium]